MYIIKEIIKNVISYNQDYYLLKNGLFNLNNKNIILEVEDYREFHYFGNNYKIIKDIRGNSIVYTINNYSIDVATKDTLWGTFVFFISTWLTLQILRQK